MMPNRTPLSTFLALYLLVAAPTPVFCEPPFTLPHKESLQRFRSAVIQTNKGEFLVELFPQTAPWHVANFKYLADKGFYRNIRFHLFKENETGDGWIVQGGDPTGTGNGGPGYNLNPEFSELKHEKGVLGMSRRMDDINPERLSNGSQFHILLADAPHMDRKYTIFGRVIDGIEIAEKLREGDTIKNVKVYVKQSETGKIN